MTHITTEMLAGLDAYNRAVRRDIVRSELAEGVYENCDLCWGDGDMGRWICPECHGSGLTPHECPT